MSNELYSSPQARIAGLAMGYPRPSADCRGGHNPRNGHMVAGKLLFFKRSFKASVSFLVANFHRQLVRPRPGDLLVFFLYFLIHRIYRSDFEFRTPVAILTYVVSISRNLSRDRKVTPMLLSQALRTRDQVTKQRLITLFSDDPATIERINEGFRQGEEEWPKALVATMGRRMAEFVFNALKTEIPGPK
ncbi:MAG: hypothetical protein ACLPN5_00445 [Roseiarcus sp.]